MIEPAEQMQPEYIEEAAAVAPKRRKRRTKAEMAQAAEVTVETGSGKAPAAPKPRARAKKLTGDHVTQGVIKGSELVALMTGFPQFVVTPEEMKPWAGEAAELLNNIPAQYVSGVLKFSSVGVVLYGMYMTFVPRVAAYQIVKAQAKAPAPAPVDPAHGEGVNGSVAGFLESMS